MSGPWAQGAAVALLAAAFRLTGLGWALPMQRGHVDEYATVFYALQLPWPWAKPAFFDYPALSLTLIRLLSGAAEIFGVASGAQAFVQDRSVAPILIARSLSALLGAGACLLVWSAARRRVQPWAAFVAGALVAVHPVAVRSAHYATPDALALFMCASAVWAWTGFEARSSVRSAWTGLFCGLGAAAKYTPGFFAAGFFAAFVFQRKFREAGLLAAFSAAGFFIGSPHTFLSAPEFLRNFFHLSGNFTSGGNGAASAYASAALVAVSALGFGLLLPALAKRWRQAPFFDAGLLAASAAYCLGVGFWTVQEPRYFLPLLPVAALYAADGFARLDEFRRPLFAAVAAAALLWTAFPSVRFLAAVSAPDTRLRALDRIRATVPHGARILRLPHTPEFSSSDPYRVRVDWTGAARPENGWPADMDFLLTSRFQEGEPGWEAVAEPVWTEEGPAPSFPHHPVVTLWRPR